jgi:ribosome maturation factor RimP
LFAVCTEGFRRQTLDRKEGDVAGSADAIRALVEPPLVSSGLELWDVEVSRDTVRVLVDRPGGVDLDSLATTAGRVVSPLLDEHPELTPAGSFSLEVSSPGVERSLRRPEHFARYIGSEVSVKTSVPVEGSRRFQGVLVSADEQAIVVGLHDGGPDGRTVSIRHSELDRVRTVLVWGPAPKPGAKPRSRGKKQGNLPDSAVKRSAADGPEAASPVASREKETQ